MSSKARQKIDPQIRDMFDAEIDRPDHDRILTTLFGNDTALHALLVELHKPKEFQLFNEASRFRVNNDFYSDTFISYAEAVEKTGIEPKWISKSPINVIRKRLEVPMLWWSNNDKYSRIIGFVDIALQYEKINWPSITQNREGKCFWQKQSDQFTAILEVKGGWPTVGNLIRQLNLYSAATVQGFDGSLVRIAVGPDSSTNEILGEHGYRLVTFDAGLTNFELVPGITKPKSSKLESGQF